MAAGDAWVKMVGRMQIETVALMTRRMIANIELPQAMARCQTPQDVMAEQVRYWQLAQRQYMQSLEKVASSVPASMMGGVPAARARMRDYILVSDNPAPVSQPVQSQRPAASVSEPLYKKSA